jgi:hypothetical protein
MPHSPDDIIEIRPCSLVGAAELMRDWYIRDRIMSEEQTLILFDRNTGEMDHARPESDEERFEKRLKKAQTDDQKRKIAKSKRARREAARKRRYRQKKKLLRDGGISANTT